MAQLNLVKLIDYISIQDFLLGSFAILFTIFCLKGLFNSIFKDD